jgi:broad specificity phosphatase PhoE
MCSSNPGTGPRYLPPYTASVLGRLHLVRHGEAHNPDHICYGDLPGFGLSRRGRLQAEAAGAHLAKSGADLLVCSPIERAQETAGLIGRALGLTPILDDRLYEWRLVTRWRGLTWEALEEAFPRELGAYFSHPQQLAFSPESLAQVADRISHLIDELGVHHPGQTAVLVSHQDPIQAAFLALTGTGFETFHEAKPQHCAVLALSGGPDWHLEQRWFPASAERSLPPTPAPGPGAA